MILHMWEQHVAGVHGIAWRGPEQSGRGNAGMEAVIANLLEPGDKIVVGNSGIWGHRVADMASRFQGDPSGSVTFNSLLIATL
jgi:hypothetical protein